MPKGRIPMGLTLALALLGLLLVIPALWIFVSITARPLHPDPAAVPSVAQAVPSPASAALVQRARQFALAHLIGKNLPGLSVAVGIHDDLVWAEGFGFADLRTRLPVTPAHRFRIGTASTALTSVAAGLLLESGRLQLENEIQTYVPAFPKKQWPVTLRELMGHTAGLKPDGGDDGPLFTKHCSATAEALPYFANTPLQFQPGTQYRYSSDGWILVSNAVEAAAHQPFFPFLREQIFEPLGMRDTLPEPTAEADDDFPLANLVRELIFDPRAARVSTPSSAEKPRLRQVTPYYTRFASDPRYGMHLMRPLDSSCYAGASALVSTPSDLVRFGMAINRGKLLQGSTLKLLQSPQRMASGQETGYGLGWYARTVTLAGKPTRVVGQDGDSLGGMVASLLIVPEYGIVAAATSNISYAGTFPLAVKVADAFAGEAKNRASR